MLLNPHRVEMLKTQLVHAGRFSTRPIYSVFATSATGDYRLSYRGFEANTAAETFLTECFADGSCGVEVRCDGFRVDV